MQSHLPWDRSGKLIDIAVLNDSCISITLFRLIWIKLHRYHNPPDFSFSVEVGNEWYFGRNAG